MFSESIHSAAMTSGIPGRITGLVRGTVRGRFDDFLLPTTLSAILQAMNLSRFPMHHRII